MGKLVAVLAFVVCVAIDPISGLSCQNCHEVDCKVPVGCKYGLAKDVCYCCQVCAKGPGEDCGGMWGLQGTCGEGLTCRNPPAQPNVFYPGNHIGKCVGKSPIPSRPGGYGRGKRALAYNRRAGGAKLQATVHEHKAFGGISPELLAAVMKYNKRKQG